MSDSKIVKLYQRVIKSVGLAYDDDFYIRNGSDPTKASVFIHEGRSLVLPTQEHIKTATKKNDDGEIEIIKMLYNPMDENVISNDNPTMIITKRAIEAKLSYALSAAGSLLLTVAENEKLYDKVDIDVSKFITSLNAIDTEARKKLVDNKSIDTWNKLCNASFTGETKLISIFVAKNGKFKDLKFNRLAKINSPFYDMLKEATKDTSIYGVKLRPKDLDSFRLVFKFLLNMLDEDGTYSVGSNDGESPAFISLMKLYIEVGGWLTKIITDLATINEETVDSAKIVTDITAKELDNLNIYVSELKLIPSEVDLSRTKLNMPVTNVSALIRGVTTPTVKKELTPLPLVEPEPVITGNPNKDFLSKLYGNTGGHLQRDVNPLSPGNLFGGGNTGFNTGSNVFGGGGFGNNNTGFGFGGNNNNQGGLFSNPFGNVGNGPRF